jgi:hypothetical protein
MAGEKTESEGRDFVAINFRDVIDMQTVTGKIVRYV